MRIAICGIGHESNTFTPLSTRLEDFRVLRDREILDGPVWGSFEGVEWCPALIARAQPGGIVARDAYESLKTEILDRLLGYGDLDGVYLNLHGAMDVEGIGDGETDLVAGVRSVVGDDPLIAGSLDLHANMSPQVASQTDILTALRTAPHIDGPETRERTLRRLTDSIDRGSRPMNVLIKLPLLIPGENAATYIEPCESLYAGLEAIESKDGILDASILIACAWTDSEYTSTSVIIVGQDRAAADAEARSLAEEIWSRREEFGPEVETRSVDEAVRAAMEGPFPAFVSDSGDNVTAGAAGDVPVALAAMVDAGAEGAICGIQNDRAVDLCQEAGEGGSVQLTVGGKVDSLNGMPVDIEGVVSYLDAPDLAVVKVDGVKVVVTTSRMPFLELAAFDKARIDPSKEKVVVVKHGYLAPALREIMGRWEMSHSPGFTCLKLDTLPYERVCRPVYPLDADVSFEPEAVA